MTAIRSVGTALLLMCAFVVKTPEGIAQSRRPSTPAPQNPLAGPYDIKGLGLGSERTVVVAFAADRCAECRAAIPFYRKVIALPRMDGKIRRFVVVAMDGVWPVKEVLDPAQFEPHRLTSGPYPARNLPGVTKAPTLLLLDRAGKTIGKWEGVLSGAQQEEIIQAIVKSTPAKGNE